MILLLGLVLTVISAELIFGFNIAIAGVIKLAQRWGRKQCFVLLAEDSGRISISFWRQNADVFICLDTFAAIRLEIVRLVQVWLSCGPSHHSRLQMFTLSSSWFTSTCALRVRMNLSVFSCEICMTDPHVINWLEFIVARAASWSFWFICELSQKICLIVISHSCRILTLSLPMLLQEIVSQEDTCSMTYGMWGFMHQLLSSCMNLDVLMLESNRWSTLIPVDLKPTRMII